MEVKGVLKMFANNANNSNFKIFKKIIYDLESSLSETDFSEVAVKGIFKVLSASMVYHHYHQGHCSLIEKLIGSLSSKWLEASKSALILSTKELTEYLKRATLICCSTSSEAYKILRWTFVVLQSAIKDGVVFSAEIFNDLLELQMVLYYGTFACGDESIKTTCDKYIRKILAKHPELLPVYAKALLNGKVSFHSFAFVGFMLKYLNCVKQHDQALNIKNYYKEQYVEIVIKSKERLNADALKTLSTFLSHLDHEDFKFSILPAVEKSLLRNPEITLVCLKELLDSLSIDLSSYAGDLGRHLAVQCISKDETNQTVAAEACRILAQQCTDLSCLKLLTQHFFKVLSGSEGKLTAVSQKINLCTAVGKMSSNVERGLTASVEELATFVVEQFVAFVQNEGLETTAIHAIQMMTMWSAKLRSSIPPSFTQWMNKQLGNKSSSSNMRTHIFICFNTTVNVDTVLKCKDLLPTFIQCLEKSLSQPFQVSLVTEALLATNATFKILEGDFELAPKQESFWSLVLDSDKQHFVNEKFLNQAAKEALIALCSVVAYLFNIWPNKLNDKHIKMYSAGLLNAAVKGDYEVKKLAVGKLKRIVSSDGRSYALAFVHELTGLLESIEKQIAATNSLASKVDCSSTTPNLKVLFDVLNVICSCSFDGDEDKMKMAVETLVVSHHPEIVRWMPDPWMKLLKQLQIDPNIFHTKYSQQIEEKFNSTAELTPSQQNALTTLAMVTPTQTFDFLRRSVLKVYTNPEYLKVTVDEYALLNWPEGQLYDKSVIDAGVGPIVEKVNIKRENKLYSYKEQLADIELKKELALKKNAKEEVKLTKKQQELMQAQLTKETNIRNLLKQLNANMLHTTSLIECCTQANHRHARLSFHWLLPCIVNLFNSPLAAPHAVKVFVSLRSVAFDNHHNHFSETLAHNTLRLLKPQCYLEDNWSEELLIRQSERVIDVLFHVTRCTMITRKQSFEQTFSCATFHYCYFALEALLKLCLLDEIRRVQCMIIIKCHVRKVGNEDEGQEEDEHHPFHLPRLHIINLCLYLIGTCDAMFASHAHQTLIDTCHSCSGGRGLVSAPSGEVQSLMDTLLKPSSSVRKAALQGLLVMKKVLPLSSSSSSSALERQLLVRLWMAKFDVDDEIRVEANELFDGLAVPNDRDFFEELASYVVHEETCVQVAASSAIAVALLQHQQFLDFILKMIIDYYDDKLFIPPPIIDQFGRIVKESPPDDYHSRHGVAMTLGKIASLLSKNTVEILFNFFVKKSLSDCNEEVRQEMLKSALLIINEHGKDNIEYLLALFEDFLESAPVTASYDSVRQSVVIMMGTLAKHLDADHPKLKPIFGRLIATLATPSEQVQAAAANCLPALVPSMKADAPDLVRDLMKRLLESEVYGERRGAAYGLAGLVKGLGILSLKQLDIISTLSDALQDKKCLRRREGALFAFEMLCRMLERLFEPYVVHLLPHLLLCFGDSSQHIRDAADETAKVVMSKLSAHGVKLVLPALLTALEEDSWRTKCGSVELLGAMAFCAPKQLSACLPNIVPKLTEVLSDSHQKVQKAGSQALKQIGSVIKNPEIQAVVPLLLGALQEPTRRTTVALVKLLDTQFVHFIDPPSLALIMPVVQRALSDRSTETRKMAAQIIGNMYSLTEPKDLSPYLPTMIPGLKQSLLSPMPEVRAASARAFGTMVKGIDDKSVDELISWLLSTLTSESSIVDRSGAAQGLSEVLGGIGVQRLHSIMPDIIRIASRTDIPAYVRDGYIMLYIYLPVAFNKEFLAYLGDVIPTILQALADETEYVRETALRAGQRIVHQYADTAIELLLPEVENGLFDDNWRIRFSSVQLMGDLLYRISGVTGKMTTVGLDEDDNFGTETSQKAILAALGPERHNRVFAGLYICRQDSSLTVRQAALHVWKVIVTHTPRMLKDIMSTLFHLLLGCLASQSNDKRQVAARTLGDIVKKLGEKVLPEIIPILEKGLDSEDCDRRQGVCIGLSEIINSTSKEHVMVFADSLIPTVQKALCDPLPSVRMAAAKTFDTLHTNLGPRTLDDILPNLLKKLESGDTSEYALDGLKHVMAAKSKVVLPYLVPQLAATPVNTRALSFLCSVAGDALTKHLHKILPAMMSSLAKKMHTPDEAQESQYCKSVVLSLQDELAVRVGIEVLVGGATNERAPAGARVASLNMLAVFCEQSKADYSEFIPQLLRALIPLAAEQDSGIINSSWDCLNAVVKKLDPSNMIQYISHIRQAVRFAVNDLKDDQELPGFSILKKGAAPLMTILREGVLNGGPEVKESASLGLTEIIKRTNAEALRPSVVNVTGALIRILGDRFSFNVKVAMLDTINLLLAKCETNMRPFLPQLQTTFVKSLMDANRTVRLKSALALGKVISIHNRIDALFTELITSCKSAEDASIRDTIIHAMRLCLVNPSCKLLEKTQKEILVFLESSSNSSEDSTRLVASACQGALCCVMETELMNTIILSCIDSEPSQDWTVRYNKVTTLSVALKEAGGKILTKLNNDVNVKTTKSLVSYSNTDRIPICLTALRATAFYLRQQLMLGTSLDESLTNLLVKSMKLESNDIKQLCAQIMSYLCHVTPEKAFDVSSLKIFVPMLLGGCKEKNAAVKSFSEHALLAVLRYKRDDSIYQNCLEFLEENSKETLTEVTNKILKKLATQPEGIEEDIDVTLLK